jgi:hypothetical protein
MLVIPSGHLRRKMKANLKLNTPEQESERLGIPFRTMSKARSTGHPDIPYIKIGKTVRYDPIAVDAWLAKHTHNKVEVC